MIGEIVEFDDLRKLSGLGQRAQLSTVERWARRAGIRYNYDGKGGIWTTMRAMNAALGLNEAGEAGSDKPYSADQVL